MGGGANGEAPLKGEGEQEETIKGPRRSRRRGRGGGQQRGKGWGKNGGEEEECAQLQLHSQEVPLLPPSSPELSQPPPPHPPSGLPRYLLAAQSFFPFLLPLPIIPSNYCWAKYFFYSTQLVCNLSSTSIYFLKLSTDNHEIPSQSTSKIPTFVFIQICLYPMNDNTSTLMKCQLSFSAPFYQWKNLPMQFNSWVAFLFTMCTPPKLWQELRKVNQAKNICFAPQFIVERFSWGRGEGGGG